MIYWAVAVAVLLVVVVKAYRWAFQEQPNEYSGNPYNYTSRQIRTTSGGGAISRSYSNRGSTNVDSSWLGAATYGDSGGASCGGDGGGGGCD